MATIATMQLQGDNIVTVDANGRGEKTFTVTNIYGAPMRMGFRCLPEKPEQKEWAKPRSKAEQDLGVNMSNQITVGIEVPKETRSGRYTFRLLAFSTKDANLHFSESEPFMVDVPAKEEPKPVPNKFPWGIVIGASVAGVLLIGGLLTWLLWPSKIIVPDIVGLPVDEATTTLEKHGFTAGDVTEEITGNAQPGMVKAQTPDPETELEEAASKKVDLVVEKFSTEVPDLTGKTVAEAEELLRSVSLTLSPTINEKRTNQATGGTVISSVPEKGQRVVPDTQVTLTVETKSIPIPNLAGQRLNEAKQALESLGLRVQTEAVPTGGPAEPNRVLSTKPAFPAEVQAGETVTLLYVKKLITVPNLTGMIEYQAINTLKAANLKLNAVRRVTLSNKPAGKVYSFTPKAGASVDPMTPVTLYVAQAPPQPKVILNKTLAIGPGQNMDLDTGKLNAGSDADVILVPSFPTKTILTMSKGAHFGRTGSAPARWNGCSTSGYSAKSVDTYSLKANTYVCIRTTRGNYAEFRVLSSGGFKPFKFSVTTWQPPQPTNTLKSTTFFTAPALKTFEAIRRAVPPMEDATSTDLAPKQ